MRAFLLILLLAGCRAVEPVVTCAPLPNPESRTRAAGWGDRTWAEQVEDIRRFAAEGQPRLVLLGDSITQGWAGGGRDVGGAGAAARRRWLEPLGPILNAGLSGDRTQHLLWRLRNGTLAGARPEFAVVMIGTNNLPHDPPKAIAAGVEAVLEELATRLPAARVLLVSCPPRGRNPGEAMRRSGLELNARLRELGVRHGIDWLDLDPLLLDEQGEARPDRMAGDFVHFSPQGYEAVGRALHARLSARP